MYSIAEPGRRRLSTKPFSFQELRQGQARCCVARLIRTQRATRGRTLNWIQRRGKPTAVKGKLSSVQEFDLLFLLMRHAGQTVTRQDLLRGSWACSRKRQQSG